MKRAQTSIALACLLLVVQVCDGWRSPSSCRDGSEGTKSTPSASPRSSSSSASISSSPSYSSSSSRSGSGNSSSCGCSSPSMVVSVLSASASTGSSSFTFDGTTSDIARQLYHRYTAGDQVDQIALKAVPQVVQLRLDNLSLAFENLPGLMQRAVLWDSGFAVTSDNSAVQVWTLDDRSMAEIAIEMQEFNSTNCEALSCPQANGEVAQLYSTCRQGPAQMLAASKCVVEAFDSDEASNQMMWATGGNASSIPEIRVVKNSGTSECGCEYTVYSINTATSNDQACSTDECPGSDWSASLIIPCFGNDDVPDSIAARVTPSKGSDWVTEWIREHGKSSTTSESSSSPSRGSSSMATEAGTESGGGFSLWWLLLILLIILLLIIATIVACRHCHRLSHFNSPPDNMTYIFVGGRMWAVEDENPGRGAGYWLRFANWCRKTFNFFE